MSGTAHETARPPHVLTAADLDAWTSYVFPVSDTGGPNGEPVVFKMRRLDMVTMLLEDIVPAPLFQAATAAIEKVRGAIAADPNQTFADIFGALTEQERQDVLAHLRQFACAAALQPRFTLSATPEGDAFPVTLLSTELLFRMWNYTPPEASVTRLSGGAATEFPGSRAAASDPAGSAGPGVRAAALDLGADAAATADA